MNDKKQLCFEGLPPKDKAIDIAKKKKRQWENGFQKWSNEQAQDGLTSLGKCGYGKMQLSERDTMIIETVYKIMLDKDLEVAE